MDFYSIVLFLPVALVLLVTPGPNVIYVITKGMVRGRKAAFTGVLGATTGDIVQAAGACLGLTALLQTSAVAFFITKILGAVYLTYLGIRCFTDRQINLAEEAGRQSEDRNLFFAGVMTAALNPKTALFFLSFLPQFVHVQSAVTASRQMFLLGLLYSFMGFFVLSFYAFASGYIRGLFIKNEKIQLYFNRITGGIFIAFGIRLAISER